MQNTQLNTTAWLFDVRTGTIDRVIDQYRDTKEALSGGFRIIKAVHEDVGLDTYVVLAKNIELPFPDQKFAFSGIGDVKGIGLVGDSLPVGVFIPYAELETDIPPIVMHQGKPLKMGMQKWVES